MSRFGRREAGLRVHEPAERHVDCACEEFAMWRSVARRGSLASETHEDWNPARCSETRARRSRLAPQAQDVSSYFAFLVIHQP